MERYLRTMNGIVEFPKNKSIMKQIFCKHEHKVLGISCSRTGLTRISGEDQYLVCEDCGKILKEVHTCTNI